VSDDELHDAFYRHSFEDFRQRLMTWQEFHAGARAAIALDRSRRAPVQPAEGEVGELVDQIHQIALAWEPDACLLGNMTAEQLARAADLLAQRHPAPVPVSERLPEPEDCDAEGRCWLCGKVEGDWRLLNPKNSGVPQLKYCFSHWLPVHALPIPS
jgi:hypothetical protein